MKRRGNWTAHSGASLCANNRDTTSPWSLPTTWLHFLSLQNCNTDKFTLFGLTHFLKGMTPSEFLTRYSLAGSNLLVLPPPTAVSAPQDEPAGISGKLNRKKQGVKVWMSEKYSGRGSMFYPRNSLRPTFISSFGNLSSPFSSSSSLFQLGLLVEVYVEWPKQSRVNPVHLLQSRLFPCECRNKGLEIICWAPSSGTAAQNNIQTLSRFQTNSSVGFFTLTTLKGKVFLYLPALTIQNATLISVYKEKFCFSLVLGQNHLPFHYCYPMPHC